MHPFEEAVRQEARRCTHETGCHGHNAGPPTPNEEKDSSDLSPDLIANLECLEKLESQNKCLMGKLLDQAKHVEANFKTNKSTKNLIMVKAREVQCKCVGNQDDLCKAMKFILRNCIDLWEEKI